METLRTQSCYYGHNCNVLHPVVHHLIPQGSGNVVIAAAPAPSTEEEDETVTNTLT